MPRSRRVPHDAPPRPRGRPPIRQHAPDTVPSPAVAPAVRRFLRCPSCLTSHPLDLYIDALASESEPVARVQVIGGYKGCAWSDDALTDEERSLLVRAALAGVERMRR